MAEETIGQRLKRLRLARNMSQRDLSEPGVSYAYISRLEADARTASVKALRKLAPKLGVTVRYLETGVEAPLEEGVADAGLTWGDLNEYEQAKVTAAAALSARRAARGATEQVLAERRAARQQQLKRELAQLRVGSV